MNELLGLVRFIAGLDLVLARGTDDRHAVERTESVGHVAFPLKALLAGKAPTLQVVRLRGIFNEAAARRTSSSEMATHNCSNAVAVAAALNGHRFYFRHLEPSLRGLTPELRGAAKRHPLERIVRGGFQAARETL